MSDDAGAVDKKRGRKAAAADVGQPNKHPSYVAGCQEGSPAKKAKKEGATPAKRGRGRPKGSGKKAGAKAKAKSTPGKGGRGRPKKTDKKADSAEEEENDDEN